MTLSDKPIAQPSTKEQTKGAPVFAPTEPKDIFGSLSYRGAPKSLAEMDEGITAEAKRRHRTGRY